MAAFDQREDSDTTVAPVRPRALVVETPMTPSGVPASSRGAFGPISTFPAAATNALPVKSRPAPGWVVAYLALCVALTIVGLFALAIESRLLGR